MSVQIYSRYKRPLVDGFTFKKPSMTSQEFKEECNINVLLKKYTVQANLLGLPLSQVIPQPTSDNFGDFTNVDDFQTAMNKVAEINNMFSNLPSDIRAQCDNRPENFLRMCSDEKNFKAFAERGIFDKDEVNAYFNKVAEFNKQASKSDLGSFTPTEKQGESAEIETVDNSSN